MKRVYEKKTTGTQLEKKLKKKDKFESHHKDQR